MKIAILGAGAIGCYYGAKLALAGEEVCFIMRSGYDYALEHGINIDTETGILEVPEPHLAKEAKDCGAVDLVMVCWKSSSNHLLGDILPHLVHEETRVITCQNGMGNAEHIAQYISPEKVYQGLCFISCMMENAGQVHHRGPNDIHLAPLIPTSDTLSLAEQYSKMLNGAGIRTEVFKEIERILWQKLTWNIPFNGLCLAHGGISVGELFTMPDEVERAWRIIIEICKCAELRGYPLPPDLPERQMKRTAPMGGFIPSSAFDYNKGRPVEYDSIWGIPLQKAQEVNAYIPEWEKLAADIRQLLQLS